MKKEWDYITKKLESEDNTGTMEGKVGTVKWQAKKKSSNKKKKKKKKE